MLSLRDILHNSRQYIQDGFEIIDSRFNSFSSFLNMENVTTISNNCSSISESATSQRTSYLQHENQLDMLSGQHQKLNYKNISNCSSVSKADEKSFLNIVIKQKQTMEENEKASSGSDGQLNVFISERQMSLDEAIIQGEAYFSPQQLEINIHKTASVEQNGVHLNVSVPERKLSFTQQVPIDELNQSQTATILDTVLDVQSNSGDGDEMNEMDMPNPGSIEHFERLFYPRIPCKNCAYCYDMYSDEIKWL